MTTEGEHSLFSASGADGWIYCRAKPLMEQGRRTSSEFADEGTAAHTLADWVMKRRIAGEEITAHAYLGAKIEVKRDGGPARVYTVDTEFADYVDSYVDGYFMLAQGKKVLRFAEQKVYYNEALGVPRHLAFGTGDGFAIVFDAPPIVDEDTGEILFAAGIELQVHDLKFGRGVRVFANGWQMKKYGGGMLQDFELIADFDAPTTRIRMVIHQPRLDHIDEHVMLVSDLRKLLAGEPRTAAAVIVPLVEAYSHLVPKGGYQSHAQVPLEVAKHQKPTDKGCRFCDGKTVCAALAKEVAHAVTGGRATKGDFKKLTVETPTDVAAWGDNWLAEFATYFDKIEMLVKSARAEIDRRVLLKGMRVPGFKIVQGKKGDRAWTDKGAAELALRKLGVGDAAYAKKLVSPTQVEKLGKDIYAAVAALVDRAEGKPAVVHESDPRPEYDGHKAASSDFKPRAQAETAASADHPFR